jgi:hypothetical protein
MAKLLRVLFLNDCRFTQPLLRVRSEDTVRFDTLLPHRLGTAAKPSNHSRFVDGSLPGVFAVGEIRSESVKRVASAVGEGSMVVHFVDKVLAE